MSKEDPAMLEMRHVTKIFNPGTVDEKIALNDLSFTLNDGDFVTVIGGNGAGKSTMQNAICGTWLPDAGEILLDGIDLSSLSEHQRAKYLGRVYQDPMTGTAAGMQIEENLALAARRGLRRTLRPGIRKAEREEYRQRLQELGLGLDTRLSAKVGTLSGGQRQALTLLMATLRKPKLLLLDEHTAALDPKTAAKVMELTERMVTEEKLSTLMITHNMRDVSEIAARKFGRAVFLGSGALKGIAEECHLKLQELTDGLVVCKFDSFLGFRHGPKAVINKDTVLVYLCSDDEKVFHYERDLIRQINENNKVVAQIVVSPSGIVIPGVNLDCVVAATNPGELQKNEYACIPYVLVGQLLGYFKSENLGLNPDEPSVSGNISRVVEGVKIYDL